jgi:hypothetical protein
MPPLAQDISTKLVSAVRLAFSGWVLVPRHKHHRLGHATRHGAVVADLRGIGVIPVVDGIAFQRAVPGESGGLVQAHRKHPRRSAGWERHLEDQPLERVAGLGDHLIGRAVAQRHVDIGLAVVLRIHTVDIELARSLHGGLDHGLRVLIGLARGRELEDRKDLIGAVLDAEQVPAIGGLGQSVLVRHHRVDALTVVVAAAGWQRLAHIVQVTWGRLHAAHYRHRGHRKYGKSLVHRHGRPPQVTAPQSVSICLESWGSRLGKPK